MCSVGFFSFKPSIYLKPCMVTQRKLIAYFLCDKALIGYSKQFLDPDFRNPFLIITVILNYLLVIMAMFQNLWRCHEDGKTLMYTTWNCQTHQRCLNFGNVHGNLKKTHLFIEELCEFPYKFPIYYSKLASIGNTHGSLRWPFWIYLNYVVEKHEKVFLLTEMNIHTCLTLFNTNGVNIVACSNTFFYAVDWAQPNNIFFHLPNSSWS